MMKKRYNFRFENAYCRACLFNGALSKLSLIIFVIDRHTFSSLLFRTEIQMKSTVERKKVKTFTRNIHTDGDLEVT